MTYCIGWKNKGNVFLISDTAGTKGNPTGVHKPEKIMSSVGEVTLNENGNIVEEWLHKQFIIQDNLIICYAGDVNLALEVIDTIRKYYDVNDPLNSVQLSIDSIRGTSLELNDIQFLFGFKCKSVVSFYKYNLDGRNLIEEVEDNLMVQIGSLSATNIGNLAAEMFFRHIIKLTVPYFQFYQMLAFCQHFSIHDYTFSDFAGDLYTGLSLNVNGGVWGADSSLIIYERNLKDPDSIEIIARVNQFVRHDCLTITSSFTEQGEFFLDSKNHPVYSSQALRKKIEDEHRKFLPEVVTYLAVDERCMSIIKINGHYNN